MRPIVGVTAGPSAHSAEWFAVRDDYVRAVEIAIALPMVLFPGPGDHVADLVELLDALVLT